MRKYMYVKSFIAHFCNTPVGDRIFMQPAQYKNVLLWLLLIIIIIINNYYLKFY